MSASVREKYSNFYLSVFPDIEVGLQRNLNIPSFKLSLICDCAISDWEQSWKPSSQRQPPNGGWDWVAIKDRYRNRSKRFDVAFYSESELVGLLMGRISRGSEVLRLDYLESSPLPSSPVKKVFIDVAIYTAMFMAKEIEDVQYVSIMNPVNSTVSGLYYEMGFSNDKPYRQCMPNTLYKLK